jgi:hypothetical protein
MQLPSRASRMAGAQSVYRGMRATYRAPASWSAAEVRPDFGEAAAPSGSANSSMRVVNR